MAAGGSGEAPPRQWPGALATFVLVAATVFTITAFWIPGFLLRDDGQRPSTPSSSAAPSPTADSADIKAVKTVSARVVKAFNKRDRAAIGHELCKGSANILQKAPKSTELQTNGDPHITKNTAKVPMILTTNGKDKAGRVTFAKESGHWCLKAD